MAKKYLHKLKWGLIPGTLAQGDERRHVLDPVGVDMPQLDLVVVQQPSEKSMGRSHEPTLMEVGE